MNFSNSSNVKSDATNTSISYLSYYDLAVILGSTKLVEFMFTFVIPPLCLVGLISNVIALSILLDKQQQFTANIFKYMKAYLACSILIGIIATLNIFTTARFVNFNSYVGIFYVCYIYIPLMNMLNLYASFLNNLMMTERVCILLNKIENFYVKNSPYIFCSFALLLSAFICLPIFFSLEPATMTIDHSDKNTSHTIYYPRYTSFYNSSLGHVITIVYTSLKDFAALLLEIACSLISTILLVKYLAKKEASLHKRPTTPNRQTNPNIAVSTLASSSETTKRTSAIQMTLILSFLSIVLHFIFFVSYILSSFDLASIETLNSLFITAHLFITIKTNANFIVLVILNKKFKQCLNSKISRCFNR
jgi:uncharacterized membrane protein